jgi:DNA-directed RNA polymerase subunit E'/Rpb7
MIFKCSVNLDPIYLDKNIKRQILKVIKERYEKKCSEYGYINKINKISRVSEGTIYDCDLSGNISYNLDIDANITDYKVGEVVSSKITSIDENIGALMSTKIKSLDDKKYNVCDEVFVLFLIINESTEHLKVGETINVEIVARRVEVLDNQIHLIAKIK